MPKYICPECQTVIRREEPVPEGKKLRCPECDSVFKPKATAPAKERAQQKQAAPQKPAAPAKTKASPPPEEEEEGGTYGFVHEDEIKKGKKDAPVKFEDLRKKFPKSKIGPALALTVRPSNWMLFIGAVMVIAGIATLVYGFWPLVYSNNPPTGSRVTQRIIMMVSGVFTSCLFAFVCYCASCMHDLVSPPLCWAGALLDYPARRSGGHFPALLDV